MTTTDQVPLVRDVRGVILGVDWRRVPGMTDPQFVVPGAIPARAVQPGDRVTFDLGVVVVLSVKPGALDGMLHVLARNERGAEFVIEHFRDELVDVVGFEDFS